MAPTRWGIIGTGRICEDFVIALNTLPASEHMVVAVAGRNKRKAEEFAAKFKIPAALGSFEELVKLDNIDICYVGLLQHVHKDATLLAIHAGRNVLCEKSLGINYKETALMIHEAKKHNVFLMEAYWSRFFPVYERIRNILKAGDIGQPRFVAAQFGYEAPEDTLINELETGGGATLTIGCYCLLLASLVFHGEEPTRITAKGVLSKTGADQTVSVILEYSNNRVAQLIFSGAFTMANNAIIVGSKGTLQIPEFFWCPTRLINNGTMEEYPLPSEVKTNYPRCSALSYEAQAVRSYLLKGLNEAPEMTLTESAFLAKLMDEIRKQIGVRYPQDD